MADWQALVFDTLRDMGAEERLVPGSRLMQELVRRTASDEVDFRMHLRGMGITFSRFLSNFRPDIVVDIRGAKDMLVGFPGATEGPLLDEPRTLREDVYKAFTRVDAQPYNYSKSRREFTQEQLPIDDVVPGPIITKEMLLDERRAFAETQDDQSKATLMAALDDPAALTAYLHALNVLRLQRPWRRFRLARLSERIDKWAKSNDLMPQAIWFNELESAPEVSPARKVIEIIIAEMTEDELRSLHVPLRAVEMAMRKTNATLSKP